MRSATSLDKAFRSLFFNRTTFGGMANSGPLGGHGQRGTGKIDSRWNPSRLAKAIKTARGLLRGRTIVLNKDFERVIAQADDRSFLYLDSPYYQAGNELYTSRWADNDHVRLREALRGRENWLLSYGAHPRIRELYRALMLPVHATYSIAKNRRTELLLAQRLTFPRSQPGPCGITDQLRIWVAPDQPPRRDCMEFSQAGIRARFSCQHGILDRMAGQAEIPGHGCACLRHDVTGSVAGRVEVRVRVSRLPADARPVISF